MKIVNFEFFFLFFSGSLRHDFGIFHRDRAAAARLHPGRRQRRVKVPAGKRERRAD